MPTVSAAAPSATPNPSGGDNENSAMLARMTAAASPTGYTPICITAARRATSLVAIESAAPSCCP
jgi:hypothetical protein